MLKSASFLPQDTTEETIERVKEYKRRENEKRIENKKMKSLKKYDRKNID